MLMPVHTVDIPPHGINNDPPVCVAFGETILLIFADEVTITYTQDNPEAFSPKLPSGTFHADDVIGPYRANNHDCIVTMTITVAGQTHVWLIQVKQTCP
jgi:hypothetical protein